MPKAFCSVCQSAQEVRAMTLCAQCRQYICEDCISHAEGVCPNCMEEYPDTEERR